MPLTDEHKTVNPYLVILLVILLIFANLYYLDRSSGQGYTRVRERGEPPVATDSRILGSHILLAQDRDLVVNRCRLVFRGIRQNRIQIDLCLLELDPDYSYPHLVSRQKAEQGFRLGEMTLRLKRESYHRLQLEILSP